MEKYQAKYTILAFIYFCLTASTFAQNPIVPNEGLNDPHVHIFNDTAYVYASHDKSIDNKTFVMENWWVWSSPDLVNWTKRSILKPEDTFIGHPFKDCWATDVGEKNGKYYWYFSEGNQQTGVVVGDTPVGPWSDPLGKPLLASDLTPTDEYDVAIFEENGEHYIIFGVWDYYIAKLNPDMISLVEKPKKIIVNNARGPYNPDGKNKEMPTDDKPFVHKYKGKYYLSWGCFYAMSDNLYGPYNYKNSILKKESFAPGYDKPTWPNGFKQGRHGSFFEWHNQWYFAYCDISQTGNPHFRDTFISYVNYRDDGTIAPIRVDGVGVGRYEADKGRIEAEDYFKAKGFAKEELADNNFAVVSTAREAFLEFPNIEGLANKLKLRLRMLTAEKEKFNLDIHENSPDGKLLKSYTVSLNTEKKFIYKILDLPELTNTENLFFVIKKNNKVPLKIDFFTFLK